MEFDVQFSSAIYIPGKDGKEIEKFSYTRTEPWENPTTPGLVNPSFVVDVYTVYYNDGSTLEIIFPRGSRIFSGPYEGPPEDTDESLESTARIGDYFLSTYSGEFWICTSDKGDHWRYISSLKGIPGYTPIKGLDYWTDEDKDEIFRHVKRITATDDGEGNVVITSRVFESTDDGNGHVFIN